MFVVDSPIGPLGVTVAGDTVINVRFGARPGPSAEHPAAAQLTGYFAGELTDFTVPVMICSAVEPALPDGSAWSDPAAPAVGTAATSVRRTTAAAQSVLFIGWAPSVARRPHRQTCQRDTD